MFVVANYLETILKASFMVVVETDRINSMKDVVQRPELIPMMHADLPWYLTVSTFLGSPSVYILQDSKFFYTH